MAISVTLVNSFPSNGQMAYFNLRKSKRMNEHNAMISPKPMNGDAQKRVSGYPFTPLTKKPKNSLKLTSPKKALYPIKLPNNWKATHST